MRNFIKGASLALLLFAAVAVAQTFPKWAGPLTGIADYTGQQFSSVNPFPVISKGSISPSNPDYIAVPSQTYSAPTTATVTNATSAIIAAGTYTHFILVCTLTTSTTPVYFGVGSAAVIGSGIVISPGGGCVNFGGTSLPVPASNQAINAITATGQNVAIQGG